MAKDTVPIAKNQMQRSLLKIIYDYPKEKDKQKIWQYFESHCAYCDCEIEQGSRKGHLDHLIAISNGGTNDIHNFVLACSICNGDEKREQHWLGFLQLKCKNLSQAVFEQRYQKIIDWQRQAEILKIDDEVQIEIEKINLQAKQDFDHAVVKMRALKQKISSKN